MVGVGVGVAAAGAPVATSLGVRLAVGTRADRRTVTELMLSASAARGALQSPPALAPSQAHWPVAASHRPRPEHAAGHG